MIKNSAQGSGGKLEKLKWSLVAVLIASGIYANSHFIETAWAMRAAIGIVILAILSAIILQTVKGQQAWAFIKNARGELKKVVWPTRQETLQVTLMVMVMVIITALILWGIDAFFISAMGWLTGQRG